MAAQPNNPRIWEAEAGELLQVQDHPRLQTEILSQKNEPKCIKMQWKKIVDTLAPSESWDCFNAVSAILNDQTRLYRDKKSSHHALKIPAFRSQKQEDKKL